MNVQQGDWRRAYAQKSQMHCECWSHSVLRREVVLDILLSELLWMAGLLETVCETDFEEKCELKQSWNLGLSACCALAGCRTAGPNWLTLWVCS